jgi:hypothetical protein
MGTIGQELKKASQIQLSGELKAMISRIIHNENARIHYQLSQISFIVNQNKNDDGTMKMYVTEERP